MLAGSHGLRANLPTVRIGSCRRKATSRTPWCLRRLVWGDKPKIRKVLSAYTIHFAGGMD